MWREVCLVALVLVALPAPAAAAPCVPGIMPETVRLAEVTARGELRLDDGRLVRLAGLGPAEAAGRPMQQIARSWADAPVTVTPLTPHPDRWGRIAALVETPSAVPGLPALSLNGLFLGEGLALADPADVPAACRTDLLRAETEARRRRRGLWQAPEQAVLRAGALPETPPLGAFRIVEGRPRAVTERRGMVFVDFGSFGEGGPSLRIARRNIAHLMPSGMKPGDLKGRQIRVRGVIEGAGGRIWMTADRNALIEVLE